MKGPNVSRSQEAQPLLLPQDAERLDPDRIVLLANGQHPMQAWRIKYFLDPAFMGAYENQTGDLPYPDVIDYVRPEPIVLPEPEATGKETYFPTHAPTDSKALASSDTAFEIEDDDCEFPMATARSMSSPENETDQMSDEELAELTAIANEIDVILADDDKGASA